MKLTQSFRPLSRPGEFPTKRGKREYETRKEFPSPREAWVVSYTFQTLKSYKCYTVSGPSRGLGGVLPKQHSENGYHKIVKFPSPLEAWVVSYETKPAETFPSPLEVWVDSYLKQAMTCLSLLSSFRPLSRVGWVPTYQSSW